MSRTVVVCCVSIHEHMVLTTELVDARILDHAATRSTELTSVVAVVEETLLVRQKQALAYLAEAEHAEAYHGTPCGLLAI